MKALLPLAAALLLPLQAEDEGWTPIFNGKDLTGWTPKLRGHELGKDPKKTFVVRDGAIAVDYSNYEAWGDAFGHLFYKEKLSNYRIRLEYRFIGEQIKDGPGWALANSGIMLHCQEPGTMGREQNFPVSLEFQLLGAPNGVKTTGNLCTPGTYVTLDGQENRNHCIGATPPTLPLGEWVKAEAEVRGGKVVRHYINGKLAMEYGNAKLDGNDGDAKPLIELQGGDDLASGWISLQSESHPCEFRKIEIQKLEE